MKHYTHPSSPPLLLSVALVALITTHAAVQAQPGGGAARSPRDAAPIDLTGYWAALITEDWQYRMIVPAKGDYSWLPLNEEGLQVAATWDPARDEVAGEACKAYAAPAIMRLPTRLRISWEDDHTLRVETDTGSQTRIFHFDPPPAEGEATWQGRSVAEWDMGSPEGFRRRIFEDVTEGTTNAGVLKVDTSQLRAGYLRKNGVPFSEETFMTEYFNILRGRDGERYLAVQTYVDDPVYLDRHYVRTYFFKSEPDGSKWNPTPCAADGWARP